MASERFVAVIDEFPYLVDENGSVPSYVQSLVDEQLGDTDSMLVLCGSSVATMESDVLGHESPLYGRRTGQIDLRPFSVRQAREVIATDIEVAIRSYAVTGGRRCTSRSSTTNSPSRGISVTAPLADRCPLQRTGVPVAHGATKPARYMSILEAIATGQTTPNDISGATTIDSGPLSKYLQTLRRLRLIGREVPVTASAKQSKRSRYRVTDEFLRFWFRFVEPNRSNTEEAPEMVLEGTIEPNLPDHVARTFEDVCQEATWEAIRRGRLDAYSDIGRWWYGEDEIVIVGFAPDDDRLLLAECMWTSEPVEHGLATALRDKVEHVRWGPETREE